MLKQISMLALAALGQANAHLTATNHTHDHHVHDDDHIDNPDHQHVPDYDEKYETQEELLEALSHHGEAYMAMGASAKNALRAANMGYNPLDYRWGSLVPTYGVMPDPMRSECLLRYEVYAGKGCRSRNRVM